MNLWVYALQQAHWCLWLENESRTARTFELSLHSLIHTLAGINPLGLQVGLPVYAFQISRCCKKKWQQSKLALPRLPEHDQLLTVLAKPTELACFSVMVHSSWHCANSYCKPAGLEWGVFTCQRRRTQEISGKFQPAFISPSHSFWNFLHPSLPLGKFSFCWQPRKEQHLTLRWWEEKAQAVCVQQQRVSWLGLRPARLCVLPTSPPAREQAGSAGCWTWMDRRLACQLRSENRRWLCKSACLHQSPIFT